MSIIDHFNKMEKNESPAMEIVRKRAAEAGWILKIDNNNGIVIGFKNEFGVEDIFINVCGKNAQGNVVVEFSSNGIPLPDDIGTHFGD